jgi:uncharacterized membrane protein YhaH (DUF805 family)
MLNSVKSIYRNYATFYGRETRKTFLDFFLFHAILVAIALIVFFVWVSYGWSALDDSSSQVVSVAEVSTFTIFGILGFGFFLLLGLFQLASLVPWLALQSRRLHDANLSAWLLSFI